MHRSRGPASPPSHSERPGPPGSRVPRRSSESKRREFTQPFFPGSRQVRRGDGGFHAKPQLEAGARRHARWADTRTVRLQRRRARPSPRIAPTKSAWPCARRRQVASSDRTHSPGGRSRSRAPTGGRHDGRSFVSEVKSPATRGNCLADARARSADASIRWSTDMRVASGSSVSRGTLGAVADPLPSGRAPPTMMAARRS